MYYGPCREGGWGGDPAVQVHRKDGRACLLMPRDTMFSEEQQEQRRGRRPWGVEGKRTEEEGKKEESGGHMSPSLLSACLLPDFMLNIDAEAENKPCPNTGVGWQTGVWTGLPPQTRPPDGQQHPPKFLIHTALGANIDPDLRPRLQTSSSSQSKKFTTDILLWRRDSNPSLCSQPHASISTLQCSTPNFKWVSCYARAGSDAILLNHLFFYYYFVMLTCKQIVNTTIYDT